MYIELSNLNYSPVFVCVMVKDAAVTEGKVSV